MTPRIINDWKGPKAVARPALRSDVMTGPSRTKVAGPNELDAFQGELLADIRSYRQLRETYAGRAYGIAIVCLSLWALLVGSQGVVNGIAGIAMWSDQVLIAVTTGVTVSVLAAFLGVIRGLFPGKDKEPAKDVG